MFFSFHFFFVFAFFFFIFSLKLSYYFICCFHCECDILLVTIEHRAFILPHLLQMSVLYSFSSIFILSNVSIAKSIVCVCMCVLICFLYILFVLHNHRLDSYTRISPIIIKILYIHIVKKRISTRTHLKQIPSFNCRMYHYELDDLQQDVK